MSWFLAALKKYADFNGRARRKEYWFFVLFVYIIVFVLMFIESMIGLSEPPMYFGILSGIFMLGVLIPNIAVSIRRLHDTDRSGWWLLIAFVPIIGGIWLLVLMVLDGTAGTNQYGEDPKGR